MSTPPVATARRTGALAGVGQGLGLARRHLRLVILVWAIFLVAGLAAVWPAWGWWRGALEHALDGDRLLGPNGLPVLKELVHYDRTGAFGMVVAGLFGSAVLALLVNPLVAGGLIGVLLADADRERAPRFFEIGARYYGPMLRALLLIGVLALFAILLATGLLGVVQDRVAERGMARPALVLGGLQLGLVVVLAGFFTAALDLARIGLIRQGSRRAVPAVFRSLRFALSRLPALALIGAVFVLLLALLAVVTLGVNTMLPGASWGVLVAGLLLHQLFSLGRIALRTAVIGAEIAIAPLPPAPVTEPASAAPETSDEAPPSLGVDGPPPFTAGPGDDQPADTPPERSDRSDADRSDAPER